MEQTYYVYTERMSVGYDGVPLIENIEIGVRKGEILTLIGPNGSGKSTILKSIIRQLKLIAGTVVLDGQPVPEMRERELSKKMSILMTDRLRTEYMTCRDVAATGRYPYTGRLGILSEQDWQKVDDAIRAVHAEDFADSDFSRISDGQRQRVLLARAVCQEPEVIVLDEPTSFLDVRHKLELIDVLKTLVREKNVAVIMSMHELDLAQRVSDRIVSVANRAVDRVGTPEEVFSDAYIRGLYGMEKGSYDALFGCVELEPVKGEPQVFVIGGGGSGIPVYRFLQRSNVPFAAGVLPENDLDWPVAKALAAEVVSVPAFSPLTGDAVEKAAALMHRCKKAIVTVKEFGPVKAGNRILLEKAEKEGLLVRPEELGMRPEGGRA